MNLKRSILAFGSALAFCFCVQTAVAENTQPVAGAAATTQQTTESKVNINSAGVEELKKIKGIGGVKAEAIVNYRTEHGPFKSVSDLSQVKGFSAKVVSTLEKKNPGMMTVE